jgi:hypothetical protein
MSGTEQMITDASAAIDAASSATTMRTIYDPVYAGELDNYRCAWFADLDMLTVSVPVPGARCRFRLVVTPGMGRHDAQTYVATEDGVLWLAEHDPRQDSVRLTPAGRSGADTVAGLLTEALPHH